VNVTFFDKEIFFAATDSFRLAEFGLKIKDEILNKSVYNSLIEKIQNCIIPANTLIELNRVLQNLEDGEVNISIEDGQIFFKIERSLIISRLIDGKYPEYKHIMPDEYQTRVVADKDGLQKLIKISSVFGDAKNSEIVLKINSKQSKLIIEGKSVDVGENVSEIKLDITGPSLDIILSSKYLLDGINNITTSRVALLFNNDSSPIALKEINEKTGEVLDGYIYIIMPIKNT
jgi:DNA polymerase-3 subunit beta